MHRLKSLDGIQRLQSSAGFGDCSEIHPDEHGATCAAFLTRAAAFFHRHVITRIERVMTGNAFSNRLSVDVARVLGDLDARHVLIRPHCPWQNGKVERLDRTLLVEWA